MATRRSGPGGESAARGLGAVGNLLDVGPPPSWSWPFPLILGSLVFMNLLLAGPALAEGVLRVLSVRRRIAEGLEPRRGARAETWLPLQSGAHPVLASDAGRERAASLIARAISEARLGVDEGIDRVDAIWRARHQHELAELVSDLPLSPGPVRRKIARPLLVLMCSLVAVLVQGAFGLWELWPLAVGTCLLITFGSRSAGR